MLNKRWQDWATLVAGLWFAVSPWVLGYEGNRDVVLYNALITGLAIVLFSAGALAKPETWEEVVDFLLGVWTMVSPWVLGFSDQRPIAVNAMVVGLLVTVLAAWTALDRSHLLQRGGRHGPV